MRARISPADGIDVALRLGSLPNFSATARKLAQAPCLLAPAATLIAADARATRPTSPAIP